MKKNICASWFTDTYRKTNIITTDRRPTITIHIFVKTYQNIYLSKYCNFAVSTSFRIFLSESSEAAALLPIFPLFDSEQIPGNMMGAAARRPKSSSATTTTIPWPRLFRGRDGTAQQPAAYCVCVASSLLFSFLHNGSNAITNVMWMWFSKNANDVLSSFLFKWISKANDAHSVNGKSYSFS